MRQVTELDIELARSPMIFGCERIPFVILIGTIVFVLIVIFGFNFHGLLAGVMLVCIGVALLRRAGETDPKLFAVAWQAFALPQHLPRRERVKLPPIPFVGYEAKPRISRSLRSNPGAR